MYEYQFPHILAKTVFANLVHNFDLHFFYYEWGIEVDHLFICLKYLFSSEFFCPFKKIEVWSFFSLKFP